MPLNRKLARLAFRTRAASLVVATTGPATLSSTAEGYARASGSFITDGFVVGQDVTPTGFTQTSVGVVEAVTALLLTIAGGRTVQASGASRSLVTGLPTLRAWQNVAFTPMAGRPYIVEAFPGGANRIKTWPTRIGRLEEEGLSVWTWYGIAGVGTSAIDNGITALLARFAPGTDFTLSNGQVVAVRGDAAPTVQDIVNEGGWARCTVTIPWRASTLNAILT